MFFVAVVVVVVVVVFIVSSCGAGCRGFEESNGGDCGSGCINGIDGCGIGDVVGAERWWWREMGASKVSGCKTSKNRQMPATTALTKTFGSQFLHEVETNISMTLTS